MAYPPLETTCVNSAHGTKQRVSPWHEMDNGRRVKLKALPFRWTDVDTRRFRLNLGLVLTVRVEDK